MKVRVFYHDKCFDGASSAAMFARFYKECIRADASFEFTGLLHRAGALFDPNQFDGDENAIVDFKYCSDPAITWWFDHHESAFLTPGDAAHFRSDTSKQKFYDPNYRSCCSFLAQVAQQKFCFNTEPLAELIHWTDIVDAALYTDAQSAVEMREPAMKLTMVIEAAPEPAFTTRLIPVLAQQSLAATLAEPFIADLLPPLMERHLRSIELIREKTEYAEGTVFFDVSDQDLEGYNKFIPYFLHPESTYNVGLSKSSFRVKVSVGSNPWTTTPVDQLVNLARICERYGGGGHARVGAISFPRDHEAQARAAARDIVEELRGSLRR